RRSRPVSGFGLESSRRAVEDIRGEPRKYSFRIRLGSRAGVLYEPNRNARRLSERRRASVPARRNQEEVARCGEGQSEVLHRRVAGEAGAEARSGENRLG